MSYNIHTLSNGIRILHLTDNMPISYIGVAIDAGTRDELPDESGMAHFVEHLLFKGTERRRSWHIINRLESVGGQLDAYTTKEETYIYATVPNEYTDRALELLADIVLNSTFPENEIEKERDVVVDEIQSYNDSPSELIYDEFEELLFPHDPIGRNILGTEQSLETFDSTRVQQFVHRNYTPDRMVVFAMGNIKFDWLVKKIEKYFYITNFSPKLGEMVEDQRGMQKFLIPHSSFLTHRQVPQPYTPAHRTTPRDTYQAHCIIGNRCIPMSSHERLTMLLLNNILGGPNMSSRLNLALRERNGLCYTIESNVTNYTDTGVWNIYFGCDPRNLAKAQRLCMQQLDMLCSTPLNDNQLAVAKRQLRGQVLIGNQNKENLILGLSKAYLHGLELKPDSEHFQFIDSLTPSDLQSLAQRIFNPNQLSTLIYTE
ncbi:MAG: insulinase family protein [Paludibacteraceae bacterium]|nr:insulinase family protein [Paludibacteraceae bacterium]